MATKPKFIKTKNNKLVPTNGGRITNKKKNEILEQLRVMIENGNIMGVTNEQLAKQFEVRRHTISDYLKQVYDSIPTEDIKSIEIKLKTLFEKVLRYSQQMLAKAQTPLEQERALRLILYSMKEFTDYLERFGLKAKAIENIALQGEIDHKIQIEIVRPERIIESD